MARPYIVGTGWSCDGSRVHAGSMQVGQYSASILLPLEFFGLWYAFVGSMSGVERWNPGARILQLDSQDPGTRFDSLERIAARVLFLDPESLGAGTLWIVLD